jgi:hypothetical protein
MSAFKEPLLPDSHSSETCGCSTEATFILDSGLHVFAGLTSL